MKVGLWHFAALGVVVTAAAWIGASGRWAGRSAIVLRADDAQLVAQGQRIYMAHCAACHGVRLEGQPDWRRRDAQGQLPAPPHDASGHTWHHADELLFKLTKYGVAKVVGTPGYASTMPAYEGILSDTEIVAVLSWIKSQWPPDIRAKHDAMNRASRSSP